jgi:Tetratricopeptide repeat
MFTRADSPFHWIDAIGVGKQLAIAAALCLGITSHVPAEQPSSRGAQDPPVVNEVSVLVASREVPSSDVPPGDHSSEAAPFVDAFTDAAPTSAARRDRLEPIAQSSDYTPDLASGTDHDNASTHPDNAIDYENSNQSGAPTNSVSAEPHRLPESNRPMSNASARRAASARTNATSFEPVRFQGMSVGKTSRRELVAAWGEAAESNHSDEGDVLVFNKSPFRAVEVLIDANDVLSSIKITLAAPLEAKKLAEQLGLNRLDSVVVKDDVDAPVCQAYPERGVLFMFEQKENVAPADEEKSTAGDATQVSQVVVQPIDARAFAYRAENRLNGPYLQNIKDLRAAIALDPEFGRAYWLLARVYLATGQADLADAAAGEACEIEPDNASFKLCRAQARQVLGEYDDAVLAARAVLDRQDLTQIDRAQALHQMGRLASLGDREIAEKTISFETRAIEIADKLATSKDARERRAAKQLLVEAHMAIAEEVARQPFNEKVESLSQWIGRASGLAENFIATDQGSIELRLYIAQHALNALASIKPTLDPAPCVGEAEEAAKALLAQSNDELWQQKIKWDLGLAYLHALRAEHTRRETDAALKYGQLAIDNLAIGASSRQAVHSSEQMVGQLYFQMGAVYAVHKLDHAKAVQWYDKAAPLLTNKRPASELYAPRREGEMLVSMGVSYWQTGDKTRALDLTQTGVTLVEAAVQGGVLAKDTLAVPYGNLATMYDQMGESTNAAKYAELAKSVSATEKNQEPQQPRIGRKQTNAMGPTHRTRAR